MNKPREFWIDKLSINREEGSNNYGFTVDKLSSDNESYDNWVSVIEKKAYTDLKERADKLVELLEIEKKILTLANCKGSANQIDNLIKEYKKGSVDE